MNYKIQSSRRKFITGISVFSLSTVAGCTSTDNPSGDTDTENVDENALADTEHYTSNAKDTGETETEDSTEDLVDVLEEDDTIEEQSPTVIDVRHPTPRAVSSDNEHQQGDNYDFKVTIENTGMAGDIGITLVFLENPDDGLYSIGSKKVRTQKLFYSDGERRTEEMNAELEEGYEGYGFRLWAAEIEADIRNEGRSGDIEVKMLNKEGLAGDDVLIDDKIVTMGKDETQTVKFEGSYDSFTFENISVEASRV